jgi:hypothetical protein
MVKQTTIPAIDKASFTITGQNRQLIDYACTSHLLRFDNVVISSSESQKTKRIMPVKSES